MIWSFMLAGERQNVSIFGISYRCIATESAPPRRAKVMALLGVFAQDYLKVLVTSDGTTISLALLS